MSNIWNKLTDFFSGLNSGAVVAFSGGVDSTVLLFAAHEALGNKVVAVTAESPSLPSHDRISAVNFCKKYEIRHVFVKTSEMENQNFISNPENRCYFCKKELYLALSDFASKEGFLYILEGTNITELKGHRPGYEASKEFKNVVVPFVELNISKDEIRRMAFEKDLGVEERPSSACLASRIPTGTMITESLLKKIDMAEKIIRKKINGQVRVRDHGETARIQVEPKNFISLIEVREELIKELRGIGYKIITLDINGYSPGGTSL